MVITDAELTGSVVGKNRTRRLHWKVAKCRAFISPVDSDSSTTHAGSDSPQ